VRNGKGEVSRRGRFRNVVAKGKGREYPSEPAPWDREFFEVFLDRDFVTQGVFHDPTIFDTTIFLTPRFF